MKKSILLLAALTLSLPAATTQAASSDSHTLSPPFNPSIPTISGAAVGYTYIFTADSNLSQNNCSGSSIRLASLTYEKVTSNSVVVLERSWVQFQEVLSGACGTTVSKANWRSIEKNELTGTYSGGTALQFNGVMGNISYSADDGDKVYNSTSGSGWTMESWIHPSLPTSPADDDQFDTDSGWCSCGGSLYLKANVEGWSARYKVQASVNAGSSPPTPPSVVGSGYGSISIEWPIVTIENIGYDIYESVPDWMQPMRIIRTGPTTSSLMVFLASAGSATATADFSNTPYSFSGFEVISAGSSYKDFYLHAVDDYDSEGNEWIGIRVEPYSTYKVGTPTIAWKNLFDND